MPSFSASRTTTISPSSATTLISRTPTCCGPGPAPIFWVSAAAWSRARLVARAPVRPRSVRAVVQAAHPPRLAAPVPVPGASSVTTNGTGPTPEAMDPVLTGTMQLERTTTPEPTPFASGAPTLNQNTDEYNFNYNQGFITGTQLQVGFQQQPHHHQQYLQRLQSGVAVDLPGDRDPTPAERFWSGNQWPLHPRSQERPAASPTLRFASRFSTPSTRSRISTGFWWATTKMCRRNSAALEQSTRLASDNRKQLQIGTLAPLDVLNADNQVSTDTQALITSQTSA